MLHEKYLLIVKVLIVLMSDQLPGVWLSLPRAGLRLLTGEIVDDIWRGRARGGSISIVRGIQFIFRTDQILDLLYEKIRFYLICYISAINERNIYI